MSLLRWSTSRLKRSRFVGRKRVSCCAHGSDVCSNTCSGQALKRIRPHIACEYNVNSLIHHSLRGLYASSVCAGSILDRFDFERVRIDQQEIPRTAEDGINGCIEIDSTGCYADFHVHILIELPAELLIQFIHALLDPFQLALNGLSLLPE